MVCDHKLVQNQHSKQQDSSNVYYPRLEKHGAMLLLEILATKRSKKRKRKPNKNGPTTLASIPVHILLPSWEPGREYSYHTYLVPGTGTWYVIITCAKRVTINTAGLLNVIITCVRIL